MRRNPLRFLLAACALLAAGNGLAFECRPRLLSEQELATLVNVVQKTSGFAARADSIRACRNWDVVTVDTVRVPQPDGTELRAWLQCTATRRSDPDGWNCMAYPARGFRADTYPGELGVWVAIQDVLPFAGARRDVALAFESLARSGEIPPCEGIDGKPKTIAALRDELTGGDGYLSLSRSADAFWIEGGDVSLELERVEKAGARAKCWSVPDIVVTG